MNEQKLNNRKTDFEDDRVLDRMLDACRFQPIDNTRIKRLVHEKIHAEAMARKRRVRNIFAVSLSAAACVALLVMFGISYFVPTAPDLSVATQGQLASAGYKELTVPCGQRKELLLPDGSRLIANSRTRVLYPEKFSGRERRIYTNGEVFLQVDRKSVV